SSVGGSRANDRGTGPGPPKAVRLEVQCFSVTLRAGGWFMAQASFTRPKQNARWLWKSIGFFLVETFPGTFREWQRITRLRTGESVAAAAGIASLAVPLMPLFAAPPAETELSNAVKFALQCNATFGLIEEVVVTGRTGPNGNTVVVRGTYKQK